jgi:hypothetical protein
MIDLLIAILLFLVYLFPQALLINGIYISAYGRTDILPDGKHADSEMILYPLYKFLNQNTAEKIYFTGEQLLKYNPMATYYKKGVIIKNDALGAYTFVFHEEFALVDALKLWATAYLNAETEYDQHSNTVSFYRYETVYKFSKYLRKPIITCVVCMASFWSIFTFLIPATLIFGIDSNFLLIINIKIMAIWIANVFCLSYLNYLLYKPRK